MVGPTSFTQFIANLAGVSIAGVSAQLTSPPLSLNTADLPASWPMLPSGEVEKLVFCAGGGWPSLTADLIVAIEPVGQSRQPENYAAALTMIDAVSAALADNDTAITRGKIDWNIRIEIVPVAENAYWAIIATVNGFG